MEHENKTNAQNKVNEKWEMQREQFISEEKDERLKYVWEDKRHKFQIIK